MAGLGTATYAALIGVSGLNRRPRTKFHTGNISFDVATRILLMDATPETTDFPESEDFRTHEAAPPSTLRISMRVLDDFGDVYEGLPPTAFIMEGAVDVNGDGAIGLDETGVALMGDLLEFGYNNRNPAPTASISGSRSPAATWRPSTRARTPACTAPWPTRTTGRFPRTATAVTSRAASTPRSSTAP